MIKIIIILFGLSFFLNIILIFKNKILRFIKRKLILNFENKFKDITDISLNEWIKDDININNVDIKGKEERKW